MSTSMINVQLEEKEFFKVKETAQQWGFSSVEALLQTFMKLFLIKSTHTVSETVEYITLTKRVQERYRKMDKQFKNDREVQIAHRVDQFLNQLNA